MDEQRTGRQLHRYRSRIAKLKAVLDRIAHRADAADGVDALQKYSEVRLLAREAIARDESPEPADRGLTLQAGKFYRNGNGVIRGPMEERGEGTFIAEDGGVYRANGHQYGHHIDSMGNLMEEVTFCSVCGDMDATECLRDDCPLDAPRPTAGERAK